MARFSLMQFLTVFVFLPVSVLSNKYAQVYMDRNCTKTIDVSSQMAGIIHYTQSAYYPKLAYCYLTLDAGTNKFLILTVKMLDIEYHASCSKDKLTIYDGRGKNPAKSLSGRHGLCGPTKKLKQTAMFSTQNSVTFEFESNSGDDQGKTHEGFEIVYTIFEYKACDDGLSCPDGGRCISKTLQCDGYDNCGKRADEIVPGRECPVNSGNRLGRIHVLMILIFALTGRCVHWL
ncbi:uncharacterized protein LOC141902642 [Tubulanus polymorphus]|uniref:uncharacterized protein LOC141902642 n=1 Tax=Tubulanus polymorphus TaxID=672921 RepID=UPI003DA2B794